MNAKYAAQEEMHQKCTIIIISYCEATVKLKVGNLGKFPENKKYLFNFRYTEFEKSNLYFD